MALCSAALNCSSVITANTALALMKTKRLLVLDLNGTILHRLTHAFEVKLFRNHPIVISNNLKPDITVHGSKIIFRPHAITFLTHVLKHFDVAVWTSSRPHNALPMVHYSFKNLLDFSSILEEANQRSVAVRQVILGPSDKGADLMKERLLEDTSGKAKLKFIWTQSECDTVVNNEDKERDTEFISNSTESSTESSRPADSSSVDNNNTTTTTASSASSSSSSSASKHASKFTKPIRKKDLSKIYTAFPVYTPLNTLIIDDTDAKLADHLGNHLCVPEFKVTDHAVDFTVDKSLLKMKKYLDRLVKEDPEDVRTFLSKYDLEDC
jgi:hypothetical protein